MIGRDRFLGAHMSIAGGFAAAVERARSVGATALQIFTSSSNQWHAKPVDPEEAEAFKAARKAAGIRFAFAHDSYLINIGSPDDLLWKRSVTALAKEHERAEALGLDYVVMHPGSHVGSGDEAAFVRIAGGIGEVHARTPGFRVQTVLEVAAGQGTNVGHKLGHLKEILARVKDKSRMGVCLDTCHLFAAGYDLRTRAGFDALLAQLDREVGIDRVRCLHLNDSKKDLGCRVDRHEHIGKGCMGLEPFRFVLNHPKLSKLPMVLETPKGEDLAEDRENLATLRSLIR